MHANFAARSDVIERHARKNMERISSSSTCMNRSYERNENEMHDGIVISRTFYDMAGYKPTCMPGRCRFNQVTQWSGLRDVMCPYHIVVIMPEWISELVDWWISTVVSINSDVKATSKSGNSWFSLILHVLCSRGRVE